FEAMHYWKLEMEEGRSRPLNMAGWTLTQLGNAYAALGETGLAVEAFERSAAYYQQDYDKNMGATGNLNATKEWHKGQAFALRGLGRIHALAGEKQKALDALSAAVEHYKGAGDDYYAPLLLNELGEVYASLGEREQAFDLYERSLKGKERMGSR